MPRRIAIQILDAVFTQQQTLHEAIQQQTTHCSALDKAFIQELTYGVTRWHPQLEWLLAQQLSKPLKTKQRAIHYLLLLGLYQLLYTRIPAHAAVDETVKTCQQMRPLQTWARPLVNGILRGFLRQREALMAALNTQPTAYYAHPDWLLNALQTAWPAQWMAICQANNQKPPMTLRVNQQKISREAYQALLIAEQRECHVTPYSADGLYLHQPCAVQALPGFQAGWVAVQDEAAQLAAGLLNLQPGLTVLDACSAPGGKTCHLLEQQPAISLLALDKDPQRLQQVTDNLLRLGLSATCQAIDMLVFARQQPAPCFDRILLDAPCSSTGIIRRHPDIKIHRTPADLVQLPRIQQALLMASWSLLKPGGLLLYSTCSVMPAENDHCIAQFLAQQPTAQLLPITADWGETTPYGRQILPSLTHQMDGFYYCRLYKPPNA